MKQEERAFAEKALKHILIGSQLDGFKFGWGPGDLYLYFAHYSEKEPEMLWLHIETFKIGIAADRNQLHTFTDENLKELGEEQAYRLLLDNRREKVKDIWLGVKSPHLYVEFESGNVLFVNGQDENYECWQVGDGCNYAQNDWLIVAVPGDAIAVWCPEEFQ